MVFFKLGKLDKNAAAADAEKKEDKQEKKKNKKEERSSTGGEGGSNYGGISSGPSVNDFISKTKSQQRQGLKPSGPELIAYARYLGIDPVADHDLLWIAVEALEAPLPCEWTEHFDSSDRVFYYNATTRVSSWTHPLEHIYRETYKTIINFRNTNLNPQERGEQLHALQRECQQMEAEVHHEITAWTEHTDEHGHKFYFNREERRSTWTDPRPAKCHILYLKMKMIRILSQHAGTSLVDGKGGSSRFEPLSPLASERGGDRDPKRPKVNGKEDGMDDSAAGGAAAGATGSNASKDQGRDSDNEGALGAGPVCSSPDGMDSVDGEGGKKKKKKKKRKEDKDREGREKGSAQPAAFTDPLSAPVQQRVGAAGMNHSQSEPSVSTSAAKGIGGGGLGGLPQPPSASAADETRNPAVRGGMGLSPSVPQPFSFGGFDSQPEGLSNVGRVRVKAGIRLQPLSPSTGASSHNDMHSSASVPLLQNRQELNPL
jgi:hypothetical protein